MLEVEAEFSGTIPYFNYTNMYNYGEKYCTKLDQWAVLINFYGDPHSSTYRNLHFDFTADLKHRGYIHFWPDA